MTHMPIKETMLKKPVKFANFHVKHKIWTLMVLVVTCLLALLFLGPYIYLLLTSLKPSAEAVTVPPTLWPSKFSLENYVKMFDYLPIGKYFFNSLITAGASTILSVFFGAMAAYGISRFSSITGSYFLLFTLVIRMVPMISIAIPMYMIVKSMG
ncbi:MAG: carbohydrate transporter permease, partial [Neobacillus sp.]|nr:carbohydrate transporter permease [Neobacillus sp.]